jgi:hypothetical protein
MFIVATKPTFKWPVDLDIPGDKKPQKVQFTGIFNRLPQSRLDEMFSGDVTPTDENIVREVMAGWEDVKDDASADLEFNPVNLGVLLEVAGMRQAIARSFFEAINGAGKRKN